MSTMMTRSTVKKKMAQKMGMFCQKKTISSEDQYDLYTQEDECIFNVEEPIVDYISSAEEDPLFFNS